MKPRILVADDAKFMRRVLRHALAEGGYENIVEAGDGGEAIAQFKACAPDLVILDITMPDKPGLEVLSEIRAADPDAKVLVCSAIGQQLVIDAYAAAGACGFLHKPFVGDELLHAVRAALPQRP